METATTTTPNATLPQAAPNRKDRTMIPTRHKLIAAVVLLGLGSQAFALSYWMPEADRIRLQNEYRTLQAQKHQVEARIRVLCDVMRSSQKMFVYNPRVPGGWEWYTTNAVAAQLRRTSPTPAHYRAQWQAMLNNHVRYCTWVRNQDLPRQQQLLRQITARMNELASTLAMTRTDVKGQLTNVTVNVSPVRIKVWDHRSEDGDVVQVFVNGKRVRQLRLTNKGYEFSLPLPFGRHFVEVLAMNEGSDSPNTAAVKISGVVRGDADQTWRLKTGQRTGMWITVSR